jgi:hypothetical protein
MSIYYGVKVDVSGKQSYIFSSNRLKEVVGASKIIEFTTEILGRIIIDEMKKDSGDEEDRMLNQGRFTDVLGRKKDSTGKEIEIRGNVHIEGGGNSIYFFESKDDAKSFTKRFTTYVLEHFDGLEVTLVTEAFDFEKGLAIDFYNRLENATTDKKNKFKKNLRRYSHGIYDRCGNNGKPQGYELLEISDTNTEEKSIKLVSKESYHKRKFYETILMEGRMDSSNFNKDYDRDFYRVNRYFESDKSSTIKDKITWMRSYYTSDTDRTIGKVLAQQFGNKTYISTEEVGRVASAKHKTRLQDIETIAGKNSEYTYIGLTQLDGNGMGDMLRSVSAFFVDVLSEAIGEIKLSSPEANDIFKQLYEDRLPKNLDSDLDYKIISILKDHNQFFFTFQEALSENIQKTFETAFIRLISKESNGQTSVVVPIVMAGDDISFWSTGSESIDLSVDYINEVNAICEEKSFRERVYEAVDKKITTKLAREIVDFQFESIEKRKFIQGQKVLYERITVSGATAITLLSYPISKAAKIANKHEKQSKEKGVEIARNVDFRRIDQSYSDNKYPSIYDWTLVRGQKDGDRKATGRPYVVINPIEKLIQRQAEIDGVDKNDENKIDISDFQKTLVGLSKEKLNKDDSKSKNQNIKLFRKYMDDENQARLRATKMFGKKLEENDEKVLYDGIELMGLNPIHSRLDDFVSKMPTKDEKEK